MSLHRRLRIIALSIALAVAASGLVYSVGVAPAPSAAAAPSGRFDAGNIISDAQFYDGGSMSESAIDSFIRSQNCTPRDGVPCLKDFRATTPTKAAVGANHCTQYTGAADESAARIIAKVSQACRISPKVLLVLMQKEQSLLTNPSAYGYERTMGWGCPDTAACNSLYFGFFNQVYRSAWQFREYTKNPTEWRYRIGPTFVQYNPNAGCGGSVVDIKNQATANLYNYTPYQPNQAALANLYGTGDSCSAYGNRNFWRMYWDWFGSPVEQSPIGEVGNLQPIPGGVGIWGFAIDPDTANPIDVHVYANGTMVGGATASISQPDLVPRYGLGDKHAFAMELKIPAGRQRVCVYALNVGSGSNTELGCWTVTVGGNPVGAVDNVQVQPGGLGVWGWAIDPDKKDSIDVHVYVDGKFAGGARAANTRNDVAAVKPGYGAAHGYGLVVPASPGTHRLCVYAINVGSGSVNTELGCVTVAAGGNPIGTLGVPTTGLQSLTASGWAIDPDTKNPIDVHLYLDGAMIGGTTAKSQVPDLGIFAAFGTNHGYSLKAKAPNGAHRLCAYGINTGPGTLNTELGCRTVEIGGSPVGAIDNGQPGFASIGVWGWVYDKDTSAPSELHVYVDGVMKGGFRADGPSAYATTIPDEYGDSHGFGVRVPASPGAHQVCVYGINTGYGQNVQLGCFSTTVSGTPVGAVDNIQTVGQKLGVWGWAIDPDTTKPIDVHIYVDGQMRGGGTAGSSRPDVSAAYPGFGDKHGFGIEVDATAGPHEVCAYAINTGYGDNALLGCATVVRK